jgi:folate-binding protein YgfZ
MVSNNIRDLAAGHGVYAFVLNPQGQIQGDLYAFNRGETLVLELDWSQAGLLPQLRRYIIMDKVEVQELGDSIAIVGLTGPKVPTIVQSLGIPAPETPLALSEASWNGVTLTSVRGDNPCVPNYEFWVPQSHAQVFWAALLKAGAQEVQQSALETFRVLCGIPKVGADIRERTLPQETAQDRALNFNKGCYIGQEIVERIRARGSVHRVLTGFEVSGATPASATPIQVDGKDVGVITSTATIPTNAGARVIALGLLRKEQLTPDATFAVSVATVKPVSLPFSTLIQQL